MPYAYVSNLWDWVDCFGLAGCSKKLANNMLKMNTKLEKMKGYSKRVWHKKGSAIRHIVTPMILECYQLKIC